MSTETAYQPPLHRYPFPLRDDGTNAFLALPRDLTPEEAQRISDYIRTLAVDPLLPVTGEHG